MLYVAVILGRTLGLYLGLNYFQVTEDTNVRVFGFWSIW